jgi:NAD+ synthase
MDGAVTDPLGARDQWQKELPEVRQRLVESLKQATATRGHQRVALGLSGGVDSTLVAYLCVEALGAENVLAVLMPHRGTNPAALSLSQGVVNNLGITSRRVNMSPGVDAYFANFPDANRFRRGFCLAWQRTGVLLDLGHHYGAFVIQCFNRSDRELGYGDANLDLSGTLRPLADLYKTQVQMLGEEMNLMAEVRNRRPSLEYWAGQTDENDLGHPYTAIDPALHGLLDRKLTAAELTAKGIPAATVQWAADRIKTRSTEPSLSGMTQPAKP